MDFLFLAVQRLIGVLSFSQFDLRELVEAGEGIFRLLARADEAPASSVVYANRALEDYLCRLEDFSNELPGWIDIRLAIYTNMATLHSSRNHRELDLAIKEINYQLKLAKACKRVGVIEERHLRDLTDLAWRMAELVSKKNRLACLAAEVNAEVDAGIDLDHPALTEWAQSLVAELWRSAFKARLK